MVYKCVNCGAAAIALYKTYGPSVLKLTKCEICKCIVDKYIEYDPVIVAIDLVLISNEAQRHVIYNTEFKSYWKLLIILAMLETYGLWHNDSLFSIAVNNLCDIQNNSTINTTYLSLPACVRPARPWSDCDGWRREEKEDADLFIWEKDFYIQFLATSAGGAVFVLIIYSVMTIVRKLGSRKAVRAALAVRALSLARASALLTLPMLVWGAASSPHTRLLHYELVFLYEFVVFYHVITVLYESSRLLTALLLVVSNIAKYLTIFRITPYIRDALR